MMNNLKINIMKFVLIFFFLILSLSTNSYGKIIKWECGESTYNEWTIFNLNLNEYELITFWKPKDENIEKERLSKILKFPSNLYEESGGIFYQNYIKPYYDEHWDQMIEGSWDKDQYEFTYTANEVKIKRNGYGFNTFRNCQSDYVFEEIKVEKTDQEFKGLFGINLDEKFKDPAIKSINDIKSISNLKDIYAYLKNFKVDDFNQIRIATGVGSSDIGFIRYVEPPVKNDFFDEYYVHILPLSGKIWRIGAKSTKESNSIKNQYECELLSKVYENAVKKYSKNVSRESTNEHIWTISFSNNNDSIEIMLFCNFREDFRYQMKVGVPEILVHKKYDQYDLGVMTTKEIWDPWFAASEVLDSLKVSEQESRTDTSGF